MAKPIKRCEVCEVVTERRQKMCGECSTREAAFEASLIPTKLARCGHVSHDYFTCSACKPGEDEEFNDLYKFCRKVISYNLATLGERAVSFHTPTQHENVTRTIGRNTGRTRPRK